MSKVVKRGFAPNDEKEFFGEALHTLNRATHDLYYLLNQGYKIKGASTFVGNHYLLSERQRLALVRAVSSEKELWNRRRKELTNLKKGSTVMIDGFNTIITLEVALSDSLLLQCMDGTIRDLAGLRGTYRIIEQTEFAIRCIGEQLEKSQVAKAIFYLDAPVSNSGRLKEKIQELLKEVSFEVQVETIPNVDSVLEKSENVVTSDAIILNQCKSWFNLNKAIIERRQRNPLLIDFR